MTEPYRPEAGTWWRFDQYEIRDGLIGPAPAAVLEEYDPWEEYDASRERGAGSSTEPPYQSFVRLVREVSFGVGWDLRPEGVQALLTWCRRYGLLGLLLHSGPLPAGIGDGPGGLSDRYSHVWEAGRWTLRRGDSLAFGISADFREVFPFAQTRSRRVSRGPLAPLGRLLGCLP